MCEGPIFHTCQEMYSNNVDLLRYNFLGMQRTFMFLNYNVTAHMV